MDLKPNKSISVDGISVKFLKAMLPVILPHLTKLINLSFTSGCFPDCLKSARVSPLFKKESDQELNNYRPVSILPILSKVFERAMYIRLYKYINRYLHEKQFGFRSKYNTVSALSEKVEK